MTNYERIMGSMTVDQLANMMVNVNVVDNGNYSFDGEDEYWVENLQEEFTTCASEGAYLFFDDAKNDLIDWLNKESDI